MSKFNPFVSMSAREIHLSLSNSTKVCVGDWIIDSSGAPMIFLGFLQSRHSSSWL